MSNENEDVGAMIAREIGEMILKELDKRVTAELKFKVEKNPFKKIKAWFELLPYHYDDYKFEFKKKYRKRKSSMHM